MLTGIEKTSRREPGRREHSSSESRGRILAAAAELFAEKGYRQTTFADVAERSGISRGSIPWHFGSKEGLLLAVLEQSVEGVRADLGSTGAIEALESLFRQPTTRLFVTLLVEALEPGSSVRDRYAAIHRALRERCVAWLEQFPIPDDVDRAALAAAFVGAGVGIHQQWLLAPDEVDLEQSLAALNALLPTSRTGSRRARPGTA